MNVERNTRPRFALLFTVADVLTGLFRAVSRRRLWALYFLLPVLLALSALIAVATSSGFLAPFVYPLF